MLIPAHGCRRFGDRIGWSGSMQERQLICLTMAQATLGCGVMALRFKAQIVRSNICVSPCTLLSVPFNYLDNS